MTQKWTHRYEVKPERWVFSPTKEARKTGKGIARLVAKLWKPPAFYYHLRDGGHVAAVRKHVSNQFFFRADLNDFFGHVNRSRVTRCLKLWLPYPEARSLASESVVKRPGLPGFVLPYGFVQSPILASLALDQSRLGSYLRALDSSAEFEVSVYVDDIVISSNDKTALENEAQKFIEVAKKSGFPVSPGKTQGPGSQVTAFNIEVSAGSLQITASRLAEFVAAFNATSSEYSQAGIVGYVESVNPAQLKAFLP